MGSGTVIGRWLGRRRAAWLKTGASLDERGLRSVRLMRWVMPVIASLSLLIAGMDDRPWTVVFFGTVGLAGWGFVTSAYFTMLEGYRRRAEIDARDAEPFASGRRLFAGAFCGAAAYVLGVPALGWLGDLWVR